MKAVEKNKKIKRKKKIKRTHNVWLNMLTSDMVCAKWYHSFNEFVREMGYLPSSNHYIALKEGEKLYCKKNCTWEILTDDNDVMNAIKIFCNPNYIPRR